MKQVFFICGADARWLSDEREAAIERFVSREMRDENLLEIYSTSSSDLRLDGILSQILSELSTIPFLPDSKRVVVVHNLADFMAGGRSGGGAKKGGGNKKRSPVEILQHFMEHDLPSTGNVLIFSNLVEHTRGRYFDNKSALYKMLQKSEIAAIVQPRQKEKDPIWAMSDAFVAGRAAETLRHMRSFYSDNTKNRIVGQMVADVRMLIQASVVKRLRDGDMPDAQIKNRYMPGDKRLSLLDQPDWKVDKLIAASNRFKLAQLMAGLERLLEIQRVLFPSADDPYVPDLRMLVENFVVEFCEGAMRKTA